MIDIIAFDADDTLWDNESHYTRGKERLKQILSEYGSPEMIEQKLDETEMSNIEVYGYGIKSFVFSMIETAIVLSGGQIKGEAVQKIVNIARGMLSADMEFYERVSETLEELSKAHRLMLITKGDRFEQGQKIARSGVDQYFEIVEIVGDKSEASYRAILARYGIDPGRFLMVGNSMRSDILPVLRLGGRAVYIPQANTWFHENITGEPVDAGDFHELEHIWQLPELLRELESDPADPKRYPQESGDKR